MSLCLQEYSWCCPGKKECPIVWCIQRKNDRQKNECTHRLCELCQVRIYQSMGITFMIVWKYCTDLFISAECLVNHFFKTQLYINSLFKVKPAWCKWSLYRLKKNLMIIWHRNLGKVMLPYLNMPTSWCKLLQILNFSLIVFLSQTDIELLSLSFSVKLIIENVLY